jgi:hypothetical protein
MADWSEDHMPAIGHVNLTLVRWVYGSTGDRAGSLGGKWRPPVGKVREWYVESWHIQGCSPHLCQLRTDGLAPVSKYWTYRSHAGVYGPSKSSSWLTTGAWLTPTASLVWLRRETGNGLAGRLAGLLWIVLGALFLKSSGIRPNLLESHEGLLYVDHVRYVWS